MIRYMPRMQVHLPDHLYRAVKEEGLQISKLLQEAIRVEMRQRRLAEESDRFLRELIEEVGEPGPEDMAEAEELARRIARRQERAVS